ncbi:MAG: hypothetical protein AAF715_32580 [Myxococcota bacterium]
MVTTRDAIRLQGEAAWSRRRRIGHYGGAVDKTDCATERVPYAHTWWRSIQLYRGNAYTKAPGALVDVENVAIGRLFASLTRTAEKLRTNSTPITSYERLGYWVAYLAVPVSPVDTVQDVRQRCAAKYGAAAGPTEFNIDTAVAKIAGEAFVSTLRPQGDDLTTPPEPTFWPNVNPGSPSHDLGGGTWSSHRCTLGVIARQLPGQSHSDWVRTVQIPLVEMLDRAIDSHATFAIGKASPFILDQSPMDTTLFGQ